MNMQMWYALATIRAIIDHHPVAAVELEVTRNLCRRQQQMTDQLLVGGAGLVQPHDMFFGNDEDMCRRLRVDVTKRVAHIVLIDGGAGNLARYNALEYRLFSHGGTWNLA